MEGLPKTAEKLETGMSTLALEGKEKTITKPEDLQEEQKPKKFMVCVDGSDNSMSALFAAIKWKKDCDHLGIVNAPEIYQPRKFFPEWADRQLVNKKMIEGAEEILAHFVKVAQDEGISNVSSCVVVSDKGASPKQAIVDLAGADGIHTVFIGTRGLSAARTFFVGSFSRFVAQQAPCNVMVVKCKVDKEEEEAARERRRVTDPEEEAQAQATSTEEADDPELLQPEGAVEPASFDAAGQRGTGTGAEQTQPAELP